MATTWRQVIMPSLLESNLCRSHTSAAIARMAARLPDKASGISIFKNTKVPHLPTVNYSQRRTMRAIYPYPRILKLQLSSEVSDTTPPDHDIDYSTQTGRVPKIHWELPVLQVLVSLYLWSGAESALGRLIPNHYGKRLDES